MKSEISAQELGLDLYSGDEKVLFGWFLASYLFWQAYLANDCRSDMAFDVQVSRP